MISVSGRRALEQRAGTKEGPMRTCVPILAAAAMGLQTTGAAQACGDKFLLVGRGVEYHRAYAAVYPASIVIYAQTQGHAAKAIRDPRLQADLKLSGHRVTLVDNDAALARALESDRVDLLLTDVADAERMFKQSAAAPSQPTVLPVMYQPTKEEAKAVETRYQCRLTSGDRVDRYLSAIDNAMKARADAKKKTRTS
jgi:ABC-type amino acid transport substrate-binding protein